MTYNIHKGFSVANLKFNLLQIREALQKIDVDIVFLQEIQGAHARKGARIEDWPEQPQSAFLAENFWPYFVYGKNVLHRGGHHGNAILSKHPIKAWENVVLSKYKRASRSLLHAEVDFPGLEKTLHIICIHFALFKSRRKKQLIALQDRVMSRIPEDSPLIIAGDFNDWRGNAEAYLENELNLTEVFKKCQGEHAKTFPAWRPKLAVDRIYFNNIALNKCMCLIDSPWSKLSDHVPLYAEFIV